MSLLDYCTTERQRQIVELHEQGLGYSKIAQELNLTSRWMARDCIRLIKGKAAMQGYSPEHDMIRPVPEGYHVQGVSTYYDEDGRPRGQWVKSQADKEHILQTALSAFREGLAEELVGLHTPVKPPLYNLNSNRIACHLIGDHHLNMFAWPPETGGDSWNLEKAQETLIKAVDKLVAATRDADVAALINLGDFLHANTSAKTTGKGTPVDVDGSLGQAIRAAGNLFKVLVHRLLENHNEVWLINVRGNHDPDAALWLNEMMNLYYENEPRVKVFDNFNKWMSFTWGKNLVVMHHGDKMPPDKLYQAVTRDYAEEWGQTKHRFCWHGHIHHKQTVKELGGLTVESWGVLCPQDSYHSAHGYGASRSMSCVVLDKETGEHSRFRVGVDEVI